MRARALLPLLTVCLLSGTGVWAGPGSPLFDQGLSAFNSAQYPQAADFFYRELQANPQDPMTHYYLGVTCHCMGRYPDATREYNWVLLNSQDPELIRRVQLGLQALARVTAQAPVVPPPAGAARPPIPPAEAAAHTPPTHALASGQGASLIPPGSTYQPPAAAAYQPPAAGAYQPPAAGAYQSPLPTYAPSYSRTTAPWLSGAGSKQAAAAVDGARPAIGATGQLRIVDVYTQWCGWCKKFEPFFRMGQQKYAGKISFERVDAEARSSKEFVKKYRINGYPTLLFFDANGKLVNRINGAPQSFDDFDGIIVKAFPTLH